VIIELQHSFWYDSAPVWFAGLGTFALAFVAVFQEWLKRLFVRPILQLSAIVSRPDCHKTRFSMGADVYYFRLRVENTGNDAARDVQVYVASVERQRADKQYEPVKRFIPMSLKWAILGQPTLPILLPHMPPRFCDFAHITDPGLKRSVAEDLPGVGEKSPVLGLDLESLPNNRGHLLEPGLYKFGLKLAASNHPVREYTVEVDFKGTWFDDEDQMLRDGFGMHL
jgi:hypothetical protein